MMAETKSIRSVNQTSTVTHPRRCSRSSTRRKMWLFNVRFFTSFSKHFFLIYMACKIYVPIDLSQILFICTANTLDTILPPLLDRCEVMQLSGYSHNEKLHIPRRFLLPKQFTKNGLSEAPVQLTEPTLFQTVAHYTQEVHRENPPS